ncbi:hypothetical protein [Flavobacterium frigoris]|uniref:Uncharacterized protein n=1 Tax=Flavobacterium frigoris (strain PS1) TaxID=1086011 RepID=H7FP74_FLAFP|nr:hypothetical protein [Flavobacterium frigoris]EIA09554.1 hypothetical protein HJ01_00972 [Flavobacterium frigoris PS1]
MKNDNLKKKKGTGLIAIGSLLLIISITTLEEEQTLKYLGLASSIVLFILAIYHKTRTLKSTNK